LIPEGSEIMPSPVVHFEIAAKDAKKQQEFYAKLFDWKINANNPMNYGLVEPSAGGIGGGIFDAQGHNRPALTIYVLVEDIQSYLDKAEKLGGTTCVGPTPIPGTGSMAMFTDPEGNMIGLFKRG
jgi:predicted enzyme related to lactoylglutathione lyase